ncbi:MAG: hypothetical protein AAFP69_06745 [Planctomycetota bacterium]
MPPISPAGAVVAAAAGRWRRVPPCCLTLLVLFAAFLDVPSHAAELTNAPGPATEVSGRVPATVDDGGFLVHHWDFERGDDRNFDRWPDTWTRFYGPSFPKYQVAEIRRTDPGTDSHHMHCQLNGGQTRLRSDLVPIHSLYRYRLTVRVLEPQLAQSRIGIYLVFWNDDGKMIQRLPARRLTREILQPAVESRVGSNIDNAANRTDQANGTDGADGTNAAKTSRWTRWEIAAVRPPAGASSVSVSLEIQHADQHNSGDIHRSVGFDDVRLVRYPQIQLRGVERFGIYDRGQSTRWEVEVLGMQRQEGVVHCSLHDVQDRELLRQSYDLAVERVDQSQGNVAFYGSATVDLPAMPPGFYRLRVSVSPEDPQREVSAVMTATRTIAVIDPQLGEATGEMQGPGPIDWSPDGEESIGGRQISSPFGWTLNRRDDSLPVRGLPAWLRRCGVAWLKYPCWIDAEDHNAMDDTAWLLGRLQDLGIHTVGMLDQPQNQQTDPGLTRVQDSVTDKRTPRDAFPVNQSSPPNIQQLLRDRLQWQPSLEPVITRLALRVRDWQLGGERDYSFVPQADLSGRLRSLGHDLQGYGQPIQLAIGWPWMQSQPADSEGWTYSVRGTTGTLSAGELDLYLQQAIGPTPASSSAAETPRGNAAQRPQTWTLLEPAARDRYSMPDRVMDLVERMLVTLKHDVTAAFVPRPMDPGYGLLMPNGSPAEMLLPWRTTAMLSRGKRNVGSLRMPGGSSNCVLMGQHNAVLVVWNSRAVTERIYLGDDVRQVDVWGQTRTVPQRRDSSSVLPNGRPSAMQQEIAVGPMPTFLVNVDPMLLQMRMSVQLQQQQIDSLLGQTQWLSVAFQNPADYPATGSLTLRSGKTWSMSRPRQRWDLRGRESTLLHFPVRLRNDTQTGVQRITMQFELGDGRVFSEQREVKIGPEGLDVEISVRDSQADSIVVRVDMRNKMDSPQAYDLMLFPPGQRQYERRQIRIPPGQMLRREFPLSGASQLRGKQMLLRAVQQDGRRVLNYRVGVPPATQNEGPQPE